MKKATAHMLLIAATATASLILAPSVHARGTRVKVVKSEFDGATEVTVEPHGANCRGMGLSGLAIGGTWSSAWVPQAVKFRVETLNQFLSINELHLSIDGQIIRLKRADLPTHDHDIARMPRSAAVFLANPEVLRNLVSAPRSMMRVTSPEGYIECHIRTPEKAAGSLAYDAARRLQEEIDRQAAK